MSIVELEAALKKQGGVRDEADREAALRFGVLLADDSEDDHFVARAALAKSRCLAPVHEVYDGVEVVEYLSGEGQYADRVKFPLPALLLLDIQMPRMNGIEVLEWLQLHPAPDMRVVMLSGSLDAATIKKALTLGADYYQTKPASGKLDPVVRQLELLMVLMQRREPKSFMKSPTSPEEGMLPYTTLTLVDGRDVDWNDAMCAAADSKRNFILVLKSEEDLEELWAALGTTSVVPERLRRWGILAMAEALRADDYAVLLEIYNESAVYLIEQLTLERNVPPRTQRYMLYCELRGIISDHATIEDAGIALLSYLNFFKRARLLPLAGIYEFLQGRWVRVKKLTSDQPAMD